MEGGPAPSTQRFLANLAVLQHLPQASIQYQCREGPATVAFSRRSQSAETPGFARSPHLFTVAACGQNLPQGMPSGPRSCGKTQSSVLGACVFKVPKGTKKEKENRKRRKEKENASATTIWCLNRIHLCGRSLQRLLSRGSPQIMRRGAWHVATSTARWWKVRMNRGELHTPVPWETRRSGDGNPTSCRAPWRSCWAEMRVAYSKCHQGNMRTCRSACFG